MIKNNFDLFLSNNKNIKNNFPKVNPFYNELTKFNIFKIGGEMFNINKLSISELSCYLGGLIFSNAFLEKDGYENMKNLIDLKQFNLSQKKLNMSSEEKSLYYKDIKNKYKKLLEGSSLYNIPKNLKIEEKFLNLNKYKTN